MKIEIVNREIVYFAAQNLILVNHFGRAWQGKKNYLFAKDESESGLLVFQAPAFEKYDFGIDRSRTARQGKLKFTFLNVKIAISRF